MNYISPYEERASFSLRPCEQLVVSAEHSYFCFLLSYVMLPQMAVLSITEEVHFSKERRIDRNEEICGRSSFTLTLWY
jgi:hypothetical protein